MRTVVTQRGGKEEPQAHEQILRKRGLDCMLNRKTYPYHKFERSYKPDALNRNAVNKGEQTKRYYRTVSFATPDAPTWYWLKFWWPARQTGAASKFRRAAKKNKVLFIYKRAKSWWPNSPKPRFVCLRFRPGVSQFTQKGIKRGVTSFFTVQLIGCEEL